MINKTFILNILFHIVFLYTILYLFFFNIAHNIEKNIFSSILNKTLNKNFEILKSKIKKREKKSFDNKIFQIVTSTKNNIIDKIVIENNINEFIRKSAKIVLVILYIILIVVVYLNKNIGIDKILYILLENILIFTIVCSIEILFFYNIILEYSPVKISYFAQSFLKLFK